MRRRNGRAAVDGGAYTSLSFRCTLSILEALRLTCTMHRCTALTQARYVTRPCWLENRVALPTLSTLKGTKRVTGLTLSRAQLHTTDPEIPFSTKVLVDSLHISRYAVGYDVKIFEQ